MLKSKSSKMDSTSEWCQIEEKVPDNEKALPPRSLTVKLKGRGKAQVLRIPRSFFPELKRFQYVGVWDAETLDDPAGTASSVGLYANITVGGSAQQRVGDSIRVQRVVIRAHIEQSTGLTYTTATLAVIADKEPAAGAPAWTTVYQGIGAGSVQLYNTAIPNYDKRFRFDERKRVTQPLEWAAAYWNGSTAVVSVKPFSCVLTIPVNSEVRFDGTATTPIAGHEMYLFGWSDVVSNTPKAYVSYEVFFTDT